MPKVQVGQTAELSKTYSAEDLMSFAAASGDNNPIHLDEQYAAGTSFGRPIAHGMLVAGLISAVLGTKLPGPGTVYLGQSLKFKAPVYIGDTITARIEVLSIRDGRPVATLSTNCYNQEGELVIEGEAVVLAPT